MVHRDLRPVEDDMDIDEEDAPIDDSKETNDPSTALALTSTGGGSKTIKHGETEVSPFKFVQRTPFPPMVNVVHTYEGYGSQLYNPSSTTNAVLKYRLNSIYDCKSSTAYSADPSGLTADTADGTPETPTFRDYYSTFYRYWHVVGAKYTFQCYISNTASIEELAEEYQIECFIYHTGIQQPKSQTGSGAKIKH